MDQAASGRYATNNTTGAFQESCAEPRRRSSSAGGVPGTPPPHNFRLTSPSTRFGTDADSAALPSRSAASTPGTARAAEGALPPGQRAPSACPQPRRLSAGRQGRERAQRSAGRRSHGSRAGGKTPLRFPVPSTPLQQRGRNCPESAVTPGSSAVPSPPNDPCESALRFAAPLGI